eukprot:3922818-Karenia_brevis.AAC.1
MYVDDEAIHLAASNPQVMIHSVEVLMRHLCNVFSKYGFKIIWKPGKTECLLTLRGACSQKIRNRLAHVDNGMAIKLPAECGEPYLRVVQSYKHLGSALDALGRPLPDVSKRVSSAMASYVPIAKRTFGAVQISRSLRLRLFMSLVVSRL